MERGGLFEAEEVAEGDLDGGAAGGGEDVFAGGGEDVAQAVVVAAFECDAVASADYELHTGSGCDAVVETAGDIHLHLLVTAV